jgi:hypothetical protein
MTAEVQVLSAALRPRLAQWLRRGAGTSGSRGPSPRLFSDERRNSFEVRTILPTAPGSAVRDGVPKFLDECAPPRRHRPAPTRSIFERFSEPIEEGPLPARRRPRCHPHGASVGDECAHLN